MPHRDAPNLRMSYPDGAVTNLVRGDSALGERVNRQVSAGLNQLLEQPHGEPPFRKGAVDQAVSILFAGCAYAFSAPKEIATPSRPIGGLAIRRRLERARQQSGVSSSLYCLELLNILHNSVYSAACYSSQLLAVRSNDKAVSVWGDRADDLFQLSNILERQGELHWLLSC